MVIHSISSCDWAHYIIPKTPLPLCSPFWMLSWKVLSDREGFIRIWARSSSKSYFRRVVLLGACKGKDIINHRRAYQATFPQLLRQLGEEEVRYLNEDLFSSLYTYTSRKGGHALNIHFMGPLLNLNSPMGTADRRASKLVGLSQPDSKTTNESRGSVQPKNKRG